VRRGGGLKISHISGKLILVDIKEINYINLETPMTRAGGWIGKLKGYLNNNNNNNKCFNFTGVEC